MTDQTIKTTSNPTHPNDPTAFAPIHCGDGLTITKPGRMYLVHDDGLYVGCRETLAGAIKMAEGALGSILKSDNA